MCDWICTASQCASLKWVNKVCLISFLGLTLSITLKLRSSIFFLSDINQRCLLYRNRQGGVTTTTCPRGPSFV